MTIQTNQFGFMDETGVLSNDPAQRFFALGLLKASDTSTFYEQMVRLKNSAESERNEFLGTSEAIKAAGTFEYKFNNIHKPTLKHYLSMVDLYFSFPNHNFSCLIVDKLHPSFEVTQKDTWDLYIQFAATIVKENISKNEQLCLIADYLGRPRYSPTYFESSIRSIEGVFNVLMIESHASLYIQMVDILIGAVTYAHKVCKGAITTPKQEKVAVADRIAKLLGRQDIYQLGTNFSVEKPSCFKVWEWKPE